MLLNTLLNKSIKYIEANPIENGCVIIKLEASKAEVPVERFIHALDVRHLGVLRSLIPGAFPKKLRTGALDVHKNALGAWRVDPKETVDG